MTHLPPKVPVPDWPLFELGQLVSTAAALKLLNQSDTTVRDIIRRHGALDPGALSEPDIRANTVALKSGARLLSAYTVQVAGKSRTVWAISEAIGENGHRASTCVLLPECY